MPLTIDFPAGTERHLLARATARALTDCLSFVVMQREGLSEALTGSVHERISRRASDLTAFARR